MFRGKYLQLFLVALIVYSALLFKFSYSPKGSCEMYLYNNGVAQVVNNTSQWQAGIGFSEGDSVDGFTCDPGVGTAAITAFSDAGGGQVTVTSAGHGMTENDLICLTGTTNYNGVFQITNVATDTFEITDTWVTDDATGVWENPSTIMVPYACFIHVHGTASLAPVSNNKTFEYVVFIETEAQNKSTQRITSAAAADHYNVSMVCNKHVEAGQRVWLAGKCLDVAVANIVVRHINFSINM